MMSEILFLFVLLTSGWLIGGNIDAPFAGIVLATIIFLIFQFFHIRKLLRCINNLNPSFFSISPFWNSIYNDIQRLQKQNKPTEDLDTLLRFQKGVDTVPLGLVFLNKEGHIEWFNPAATHLLGLQSAKDNGRNIMHLLRYPELHKSFQQKIDQQIDINRGKKWIRIYMSFFAGHSFIIAQDISRVHYLELARRELLGNVSHELRSPLTVIHGYAEILEKNERIQQDAHLKQVMAEILRCTKNMDLIIRDLLSLENLENKQLVDSECETFAINTLCQEIVDEAQNLIKDKDCSIQIQMDSDVCIYASRRKIRSAFMNLLRNAVYYSDTHNAVRLHWYVNSEGGHFAVIDYGQGIAAQHIPHLTERFYRVGSDRSRDTGGTGLGLAIVKHVLQQHSASLHIKSEIGKGSTFRCYFPTDMLRANLSKSSSNI